MISEANEVGWGPPTAIGLPRALQRAITSRSDLCCTTIVDLPLPDDVIPQTDDLCLRTGCLEVPVDLDAWSLTVDGLVDREMSLSFANILAMP